MEMAEACSGGQATAVSVLEALQHQRETIQRSQAALRGGDQSVQQSQKTLQSMSSWWPWSK